MGLFRKGIRIFFVCCLFCCASEGAKKTKKKSEKRVVAFDENQAYKFVKEQVDFGPRVPNTTGHQECRDYLIKQSEKFSDTVYIQDFETTAFDNKKLRLTNIVASLNPHHQERVLLVAHWDTRPFADNETIKEEQLKPILGANDGASGVAVLLEILRQLREMKYQKGVDVLLVDGEDYGQPEFLKLPHKPHTYCLGSQYWSKTPHIPNYKANYGILLDMVGRPGATFGKEEVSMVYAFDIVEKVWKTAQRLGYGSVFINLRREGIIDDHYYINRLVKIPTIDIIDYDPQTVSGFNRQWHTHRDNMEHISKRTLRIVGEVLMETIVVNNE